MSKIYFNLKQLGDDQSLIENALKIALDNNLSSVMLTRADDGYPIMYVNPAFTKLTGYSYNEVAAKTLEFCRVRRLTISFWGSCVKNWKVGINFTAKPSTTAKMDLNSSWNGRFFQ